MSFLLPRPSEFVCQNRVPIGLSWLWSLRSQGPDVRWQRPFSNRVVTLQKGVHVHERREYPISGITKDKAYSISYVSRIPVTEDDPHSLSAFSQIPVTENAETITSDVRRPRALQAILLRPLKRKAEYGVPACDLQLRSYGPRNVEFFADFALRAAYYLGLPASGPVPLPRTTERWTVPRSNFIFKKSQENFERITFRRLIQIQDANTESVEIWLAFLRKHAYYGIGMKANVWQHEKLGVGKTMDVNLENLRSSLDPAWSHFGRRKTLETFEKAYQIIKAERFKPQEKAPDVAPG